MVLSGSSAFRGMSTSGAITSSKMLSESKKSEKKIFLSNKLILLRVELYLEHQSTDKEHLDFYTSTCKETFSYLLQYRNHHFWIPTVRKNWFVYLCELYSSRNPWLFTFTSFQPRSHPPAERKTERNGCVHSSVKLAVTETFWLDLSRMVSARITQKLTTSSLLIV